MSRISKPAMHNVIAETAERIKGMDANGNGKISRAEIKAGTSAIKDHTEKALTETFAKFSDHRDAKPGAQLTASDLDRTVDYTNEHVIDRLDTNNDGLSKSELKKGSLIATLAAQVAKAKE